jgi:hypothetical protein
MNERIRELAHKAGLPTYNPEGIPTKLEKFAELIVKECVDIVDSHRMKMDSGPTHIIEDFKQHFGVEEK